MEVWGGLLGDKGLVTEDGAPSPVSEADFPTSICKKAMGSHALYIG